MEIRVICAQCGKEFTADRRNKKYCSPDCYQKHHCQEKSRAWAEKRAKQIAKKETTIETVKECKHKNCAYRSKMSNKAIETCDYFLITNKPRGCKISECDKFKPKEKSRRSKVQNW